MLYCVTLTLIFKVKNLLVMHLLYKIAQTADVPGRFALTRTAPAMELLLYVLIYEADDYTG